MEMGRKEIIKIFQDYRKEVAETYPILKIGVLGLLPGGIQEAKVMSISLSGFQSRIFLCCPGSKLIWKNG